jgi:hypothetical protein
MALAASAWVTFEQELNLPLEVVAVLVVGEVLGPLVVGAVTGALVVGAAPDGAGEEDEPHAASRMAAGTAARIPTAAGRTLIRSPDRFTRKLCGRNVFHEARHGYMRCAAHKRDGGCLSRLGRTTSREQ